MVPQPLEENLAQPHRRPRTRFSSTGLFFAPVSLLLWGLFSFSKKQLTVEILFIYFRYGILIEDMNNASSAPSSNPKAPVIIGLAALVVIIVAVMVLRPNKPANAPAAAPAATENQVNVQALVGKLASKNVPVKADEIPVVAQIKDVISLRTANPTFYREAQNGDLIYIWSDRVVLFSVSKDRVLQLAPLIADANQQAIDPKNIPVVLTPGETLAEEDATVEIRNGSGRANGAQAVRTQLIGAKLETLAPTDTTGTQTTLIMPVRLDRPMGNTLKTIQDLTKGQIVPPNASYGPFKGDVVVIVGSK